MVRRQHSRIEEHTVETEEKDDEEEEEQPSCGEWGSPD